MKRSFLNLSHKPWIFLLITHLGISLKFHKLDHKIFWEDEIYRVLHVAGAHNILDLFRNAVSSIWWRYHIFSTIPVILIASGYFAGKEKVKRLTALLVYSGLVAVSLYSVHTISRQKSWYLGGDWVQEGRRGPPTWIISPHGQEHPSEIGDQPDQPDKQTETMEPDFH